MTTVDEVDRPRMAPRMGPRDAPSRSDWLVRGLSQLIGGPLGDHARRRPAVVVRRVVLALIVLTLGLHWLQKSPCRDARWTNLEQYTRLCYSDIIPLYGAADGLSQGGLPYLSYPLEYPVLTGYFMTVIGRPVYLYGADHPEFNQAMWFYSLTALALFAFAIATVAMILALRQRRPWDAALFAVAPVMLVTATVNWDLLAVVLAVGGILAWARRRPVLAGVLLGLGTAAKLWPGFLFLALIFLGLRAGRNRPVWTSIGAGVLAWLVANVPVMLANFENWLRFLQLNTHRPIDWGTFWYVGRYFEGQLPYEPVARPFRWLSGNVDWQLNWLTYLLFLAAVAGIGWLAWKAPRRPRYAALAFLLVAAFLLTGKVWSQQFVLWLLPLAVLARPRWGAFLAWQAAEIAYFVTFYGQMILATREESRPEGIFLMPEGWFILAASLRWLTLVVLCGFVIHDILHPDRDAVRRTYPDDPDGGVLDRAPDLQPPVTQVIGSWLSRRLTRPATAVVVGERKPQ